MNKKNILIITDFKHINFNIFENYCIYSLTKLKITNNTIDNIIISSNQINDLICNGIVHVIIINILKYKNVVEYSIKNTNLKIILFSNLKFDVPSNCIYLNNLKYSNIGTIFKYIQEIQPTIIHNTNEDGQKPNIIYKIDEQKPNIIINENKKNILKPKQKQKPKQITNNKLDVKKEKFRTTCLQYIDYIRQMNIPDIQQNSNQEAVFIECRKLPHSEVIIRNCIYNLGDEWSYTIICDNNSYKYYKNMCKEIHPNINVICLKNNIYNQDDYNNLLLTKDFWHLIKGEKILIYQEDSFIFKNNIQDFLKWDFIGAPFKLNVIDGNNQGNGGLSLRSKSKMLQVLNNISYNELTTKINDNVKKYMSDYGLNKIPEDVFFSTALQKYNIGLVADIETAKQFSSEQIYCEDSFGMHCLWHCYKKWHEKITLSLEKYNKMYDIIINYEYKKTKVYDNILIYAIHPQNIIYQATINEIKKYFDKIYVIYSIDSLYYENSENIEFIQTENIGYDFKKYYLGMEILKKTKCLFKKLWLMNDSFIMFNWDKNFFTPTNLKKIEDNDFIGVYFGYALIEQTFKKHLQSYLLIMNQNIFEEYYKRLYNNKFLNKIIDSEQTKQKYIYELEVNLCNDIINLNKYKIISLYGFMDNIEIKNMLINKYKQFDYLLPNFYSIKYINDNKPNQAYWMGPFNNIFKTGYIFRSSTPKICLYENIQNGNFELNLYLYFHLDKTFVDLYNFFYNKKTKINSKLNIDEITFIYDVIKLLPNYNLKFTDQNCPFFMFIKSKINLNMHFINFINKKLNINKKKLFNNLNLINYIKKYDGCNMLINNLKRYFYITLKNKTSVDDLILSIKNHQNKTKNKKLVYTNNINSYDTFWDIDDKYLEKDTDYIYISNVKDDFVCKNFTYIYCNLENEDPFYQNRMIKFDKTLFNCYDKILYIDANVRINNKLFNLFNLIDDNDLLLFSHPERKYLNDEINTVENISKHKQTNKTLWNVDNELLNDFSSSIKNDNYNLYWLNVHFSNTKHNIFNMIYPYYCKYKFKRDQIYFSFLQNNYKIKILNIYNSISELNTPLKDDDIILDNDYGFIKLWSEYFNRPLGGIHL